MKSVLIHKCDQCTGVYGKSSANSMELNTIYNTDTLTCVFANRKIQRQHHLSFIHHSYQSKTLKNVEQQYHQTIFGTEEHKEISAQMTKSLPIGEALNAILREAKR